MELADSITEVKTVCACGAKATVNARLTPDGRIVTEGEQVFLGGNDALRRHVPPLLEEEDNRAEPRPDEKIAYCTKQSAAPDTGAAPLLLYCTRPHLTPKSSSP